MLIQERGFGDGSNSGTLLKMIAFGGEREQVRNTLLWFGSEQTLIGYDGTLTDTPVRITSIV